MFFLVEITNTTSGIAKAITEKNDYTQALMAFHQTLASAMANENVSSCVCLIINNVGITIQKEYWTRNEEE